MANTFDEITDPLRDWVSRQGMFFVATAPLSGKGHVNLSPKGRSARCGSWGPGAYLDVGGSGAETIAHVRENGRIVIMLCAFDGRGRFHGRGTVVMRNEPDFDDLLTAGGFQDASLPQARRSIVDVDVTRVSDSCGYLVPRMSIEGQREHHQLSTAKRLRTVGAEGTGTIASPSTRRASTVYRRWANACRPSADPRAIRSADPHEGPSSILPWTLQTAVAVNRGPSWDPHDGGVPQLPCRRHAGGP